MSYQQSVADTLNQHISNFTGSRMVARHVLDCLVAVDTQSGDIKPWLATSWELSSDGLNYTFHLRSDPKFHDGSTFDAAAVKYNFDYTVAPNTKRGWAYGAIGGTNYDHSELVDDHTVKVVFKQPYIAFLSQLSDGGMGIDSPTAIKKYGSQYGLKALVGTGSFKFVEMTLNDHVTLERNPDYQWGPAIAKHQGPAYLDKLIFHDIAENPTRAAALQNGNVNMARLVASTAGQFKGSKSIRLIEIPKAGTSRMYLWNTTKPPADDIQVRKALNMAVDKSALLQLPAWGGFGKPAIAPLPSNMVPNHDLSSLKSLDISYDPQQAEQLLDQAGWKMGSGGIRTKNGQQLAFNFVIDTADVPQSEPLNGFFNKVGAKINIQSGDFNFWIDSVVKKQFGMTLISDSSYNPSELIEEFFESKGPYADYLPPNTAIDNAIESAVGALTISSMWSNLFTAMKLILEQVPGIMAWEDVYIDGARQNVQQIDYNEDGFPWFYDTWLSS